MTRSPSPHPRRGQRVGFALVITVMLMVLLVVLAVGLLTLSAVSLRVTGAATARAQAQANARLAIALAIAQLQKQTGPDQRITAPADFLAPADPAALANPGWRGVWKSNDPTSATATSFQPARADFFREWLVTATETPLALEAAGTALPGESALIRRAAGLPDVRVPLLAMPNHGWLGWWTDDESLKARADFPVAQSPTTGELLAARHAASRVEVTVTSRGDHAVLSVADDGPGIPPADRLRVFDRFVRLDSARSRGGGGTGLGLSIAAEIVAAHGGNIAVCDRLGGGNVVTVQLPLTNSADSSR